VNAVQTAVKERIVRFAPPTLRGPGSWKLTHRRGPRPARRELPARASATVWVLVGCCLLAVWFLLYALVLSGLQEARAQTLLYAQIREQFALGTGPVDGPIPYGSPVAVMSATSVGLTDVVVVEGTTAAELTAGPGHLSNTPLPGEAGVSVIMGRSTTFGRPFGQITSLRSGDEMTITTSLGTFVYTVSGVRYPGDRLPAALPAGGARLVLVTSYAEGWRTGWAPDQTVFVDATLQGKAQPTGRTPSTIPDTALPMQGLPSALMPLVLWMQGLVIAAVGIVWGRRRWGGWKTWLVGLPVAIALLWAAAETAILLLPNVI
jgi:sortase A